MYCVPIKDIAVEFPILGRIWTEYKGMINYGTDFKEQPKLIKQSVENNPILKEFRREIMDYPTDKKNTMTGNSMVFTKINSTNHLHMNIIMCGILEMENFNT